MPKCSLPSSNSFFKNRGSKKWWKFGSILKVEPTYFLDGFDVGYEKMKVTEGMTQRSCGSLDLWKDGFGIMMRKLSYGYETPLDIQVGKLST